MHVKPIHFNKTNISGIPDFDLTFPSQDGSELANKTVTLINFFWINPFISFFLCHSLAISIC